MRNWIKAFLIAPAILMIAIVIISCVSAYDGGASGDASSKAELIMQEGSIEVWRIRDSVGAVVNTCYIVLNTISNGGQPDISCP